MLFSQDYCVQYITWIWKFKKQMKCCYIVIRFLKKSYNNLPYLKNKYYSLSNNVVIAQ